MCRVSKGDELRDGGLVEGLDFGHSVMLSAVLWGTAELPQSGRCGRKITNDTSEGWIREVRG